MKAIVFLSTVVVFFFCTTIQASPIYYQVTGNYYDRLSGDIRADLSGIVTFESVMINNPAYDIWLEKPYTEGWFYWLHVDVTFFYITYGSDVYWSVQGAPTPPYTGTLTFMAYKTNDNKVHGISESLWLGEYYCHTDITYEGVLPTLPSTFTTHDFFLMNDDLDPDYYGLLSRFSTNCPLITKLYFSKIESVPEPEATMTFIVGVVMVVLLTPLLKKKFIV